MKLLLKIEVEEYASIEKLPLELKTLSQSAIEARQNAYAPYSNFHVGAAVLLENGVTIQGNNQENAAYPSGLCAERVALFYANAHYPDSPVKALAICAGKEAEITVEPVSPCGSCRQVIVETEHRYNKPMKVILIGQNKVYVLKSGSDLLPINFSSKQLL